MSLPHFSHLRVFTSSGGKTYGRPLSSSSSAHRWGVALSASGAVGAAATGAGSRRWAGLGGGGAGSDAGRVTYPHQLHGRPSLGIPVLGTPSTVPQAEQVMVERILSARA